MADIIDFKQHVLLKRNEQFMAQSSSDDSNSGLSSVSLRPAEAHRAAELRHIYDALSNVKRFDQSADAYNARRALTEMLDEASKRGVTRTSIAKACWPNAHNPAQRFRPITLPKGPKGSKDRTVSVTPGPYRKVVEKVVEQVDGWSEPEALVRVFRGTRVDRELQAIISNRTQRATDPEACWHNLSAMLSAFAQSISRKYDLPAYFKRIAQTPGRYDLSNPDGIVPSSGDRLLHYGPLANDFALWEHHPPIPSLPLFDELLAAPFLHLLRLEGGPQKATTQIEVEVRVWCELRLAIGPADSINRAEALFEVRTRAELISEGRQIYLPRPWLYLDHPEETSLTIDGARYKTTIDFSAHVPEGETWKHLVAWKKLGYGRSDLQPEHNCAAWRPSTSDVCAEILARPSSPFGPQPKFSVYGYVRPDEPTEVPEFMLGSILEKWLRATGEASLLFELGHETQRLISLVNSEAERRHDEAVTLNNKVFAQWGKS